MILSFQILPCIQFMSFYAPNISRTKIVWFSLDFLAFMEAIILDSFHTGAIIVIVRHPLTLLHLRQQKKSASVVYICIRWNHEPEYMNGPSLWIPHFASDSKILGSRAAFSFRRPRFTSDNRIQVQTAAFCFRWPRFASDGRILLWTAALWARIERNNITSHFPQAREWIKWASEQMSAAECASEASSVEQANEWAVWANKRTDERVTQ